MVERFDHRLPPEVAPLVDRRAALQYMAAYGSAAWSLFNVNQVRAYEAAWQEVKLPSNASALTTEPSSAEIRRGLEEAARFVFRVIVRPRAKDSAGCGFILKAPAEAERGLHYNPASTYMLSNRHVIDDIYEDNPQAPVELIFPKQSYRRFFTTQPRITCSEDSDSFDIALLEYPTAALQDLQSAGLAVCDGPPLRKGNTVYSLGGGGKGINVHEIESEAHRLLRECVRDTNRPQAGLAFFCDNGDKESGSSGSPVLVFREGADWECEVAGIHHRSGKESNNFGAVHSHTIREFLCQQGIFKRNKQNDVSALAISENRAK